jgi:MFS family permease
MAPSYLTNWLSDHTRHNSIEFPWTKSFTRSSTSDLEAPDTERPTKRPRRPSNKPVTDTQAWLQVAVNFLVMFNSFGLIQSFGIFQLPYERSLHAPPSKVAWIGSIHIFLVYFTGTFSGCALDRGYYKRSLALGSALQIIGLLVAGFSKSYAMTLVFHGVFQGVGHGLMFCATVTTTANYFAGSNWKMMGLGIAGCGASVGGMVFPAIAKYTINTLGVSQTLWIMCGVVAFFSMLIQVLGYSGPKCTELHGRSAPVPLSWKSVVDWRAFGEFTYASYVAAMFFVFVGLWIPFCKHFFPHSVSDSC